MPRGVRLTEKQRAEIVRRCDAWEETKFKIGRDYGVTRSTVEKICQAAHLEGDRG